MWEDWFSEIRVLQERKAEAAKDNSLVTYKDQLGYGVHIIVVMGVFYLMGHMIAASVSSKLSVVSPLPSSFDNWLVQRDIRLAEHWPIV